ncbi:MAG: energy transducer TonB [Acidobacteriota bacterium]|nr:energy transducer TonB [Acidobacteriota bacterium]
MSSNEPGEKFISEDELKSLLERWLAPEASKTLDQRVANSYHREIGSARASQSVLLPLSQKEVVTMKFCSSCKEEFADKFSFCPVDGTPLSVLVSEPEPKVMKSTSFREPLMANSPTLAAAGSTALVPRGEFHLTFIDDAGLVSRLSEALKEVARESQLTWPEFKRDPFGFSKRMVAGYGQAGWRFMSRPNVATGVLTALFVMISAVLLIIWLDRVQTRRAAERAANEELVVDQLIEIPAEQPTPDVGTAGLAKGKGGGEKPKQEKAGGGGGGGREELKPASAGKAPQADLHIPPVVAPDPHPPQIKNPVLPVAAQLDADKVLFPPDPRALPYGLKAGPTDPSSGPGTGNGMGTGKGGGMGPGEGSGYGPGRGGNTGGGDRNEGGGGPGGGGGGTDYNKVFSGKDVSSKARVLSKPEPQYTEEARKNQVTGTVVLRAVFTSGGQVTNIRSVSGLPYGLTERAIAAARQMKFSPATKDGHAVSMYIQLEYNFNLY